jgi:hypothetical protein
MIVPKVVGHLVGCVALESLGVLDRKQVVNAGVTLWGTVGVRATAGDCPGVGGG